MSERFSELQSQLNAANAECERWKQYTAGLEEVHIEALLERNQANATIAALRDALSEISEGKGRYNMDPLTHADNCIEDMKALAVAALAQPLPPAAAKLLAERDAGRALYEAIMHGEGRVYLPAVHTAVDAYKKVVMP